MAKDCDKTRAQKQASSRNIYAGRFFDKMMGNLHSP